MKKDSKNIYDHSTIEPKWQSKWEIDKIYHPDLDSANSSTSSVRRRPFYNLMMFPYPSAEGLHIGGVRTFSGVDIYGRFKRMQGYDVFEPFGLDGFGIHAENYALKIGKNPMDHSHVTEKNFYRQIRESAIGVDWERTVETYKPDYYKWTQWLFTELFKAGLAYRKKSPVNFCPSCKTVLADEQVIDGKCERCSSVVEKKNLEQWFFRITKYADRLLANIDSLNWTEKVKIAQRNWIGKKVGIEITYPVILGTQSEASRTPESQMESNQSDPGRRQDDGLASLSVSVFTTRPDTNFGATFIALAPEHELVQEILKQVQDDKKKEIKDYVETTKAKTEIDRQAEGREKTGVFTGFYAVNQLTGYKMPIWVSDFVLMGFGTGAVVGVPGHDRRDFEFAVKFGLEIIRVVVGNNGDKSEITKIDQVQEEEGTMINSDFLNGLDIHKATAKIMDYLEQKGYGKRQATYHLRDWLISRQRYWGPPIPMVYCASCAKKGLSWFNSRHSGEDEGRLQNLSGDKKNKSDSGHGQNDAEMAGWFPEENLPVELPYIEDFKPLGSAKQNSKGDVVNSPLGNHPEFYNTKCPHCGKPAKRETDVSDTFLDSAWYFLRYLATGWDNIPFPSEKYIKNQISIRSAALPAGRQGSGHESKNKEEIRNLELEIRNSSRRLAWLPVTMYIGGAEHSVLHLLYARFITMFLKDSSLIQFDEPFARFYAHGLIIKEGAKMSKSKGNVVGPDIYVKKFGADTLRMYLHFLAPFDQDGDFRDSGIEGMNRFLKKVWRLFSEPQISNFKFLPAGRQGQISNDRLRALHQTIKNVTEEMEALRFNTSIAHLMTWYNFLAKQDSISHEEAEVYLKLLAPFAPHMTEELYQDLQGKGEGVRGKDKKELHASPFTLHPSIHTSAWPEFDEKYLVTDIVKIPVQVNGKFRSTLDVSASEINNKQKIEDLARKDEKVAKFLKGYTVKQVIYIEGKVLNFVV